MNKDNIYRVKHLGGVTRSELNGWAKANLIDNNWRFNFAELLWLRIVKTLREFGFVYEKIEVVKTALLSSDIEDELAKTNNAYKIISENPSIDKKTKDIQRKLLENYHSRLKGRTALDSFIENNLNSNPLHIHIQLNGETQIHSPVTTTKGHCVVIDGEQLIKDLKISINSINQSTKTKKTKNTK